MIGNAASPAQRVLPTSDQVVGNLPWRWRTQGAIFVIGGLGFMFDAWDVALNGFLIPLLSEEWSLRPGQAAWMATSNLIGMALGAFVWGGIADRIGRKRAFTLTLLMFSLFTVAGAASPGIEVFCLFRFLAGVGLGGCIPVDYALVGEFTPTRQRGRVLTAMDGWWPIGATLCAVVSASLLVFDNWRLLMLVMVLPALLVVWVRRSVPESPLYLARSGQRDEANKVIGWLVQRTGGSQTEWTLPAAGIKPSMSLSALTGQLARLWTFSWRITLVSWLLFVSVLLTYYAALTWLPKILKSVGYGDQAAFMVTAGMTGIGILGVIVCAWLVEIVGRKWILGVSAVLSAASLLAFALMLGNPVAAQISILCFGFFIQVSVPALYTYVSELYPTQLRGSGFGWASAASRLATGIAPLLFAIMWPLFGLTWTFAGTAALVLVAVIAMAVLTRETRAEQLA
ncbi:MFS transporter [Saxibacter everestensis]|uniref:MFS transporter n=1 Tax=Saxibacter everestensis TaxID=2909229 RepID=A0ABY8QXC9_9MICO|nr:MFS transporter [Brevibacteriaceae bacterium ZFBP1038]